MADKSLFKRLNRLFSGDVVVRNIGGNQLKIADINHIQTTGRYETNSLLDRFSRLYIYNNKNIFNPNLNYQTLRIQLYSDYEAMDTDAIIASALDVVADEATLKNDMGEILSIKSSDENIQKILYNLFYDILNIEFNLWSWVRNTAKYGDFFLKLEIAEEIGVYNAFPYTVYHMTRQENQNPNKPGEVTFQIDPDGLASSQDPNYIPKNNRSVIRLDNYEVVHFRLIADTSYLPYGRCLPKDSYIEMEKGVKQIHEIEKGDRVWTYNLDTRKLELGEVLNTCSSGEKDLIRVETRHNIVRCSDEHPILTLNAETREQEYKKARDIEEGDLLVISQKDLNKHNTNPRINKDLEGFNKNGWKNKLNECIPDYVTPEFARFFGFMIGDGYLTGTNKNLVAFAQGVYPERNKKYRDLLRKFTGKEVKFFNGYIRDTEERAQCGVGSKMLATVMRKNGFIDYCYNKRLPEWIYKCDSETQIEMIRGLVDADGSMSIDKWNTRRHQLMLSSKELLQDVKILLGRLGIKSGKISALPYKEFCYFGDKKYNVNPGYYIYFYLEGNKINQFKKFNYLNTSEDVILSPVVSIEREEVGEETYDIQVSKNSNFIANGIIVHNSYLEPGRKLYKQLCLEGESKVWTKDGYKYIKDIRPGDEVFSYDYEKNELIPTTVKNQVKTGQKEVFKVSTGHRTIKATAEHPLMVSGGTYKNVSNLTIGDYLVLGNTLVDHGKIPTLSLPEETLKARIKPEVFIKPKQKCLECGEYFGRLTGKHLTTHNLNVKEYYEKHSIGDSYANFFYRNGKIPLTEAKHYLESQELYSKEDLEVFYDKAKKPFISEEIIKENLSLFIRFFGFMLGDGWLDRNLRFSLGNRRDKSDKYLELFKKMGAEPYTIYEGVRAEGGINSIYLAKLFEQLDFRTGTMNKVVPTWVYELPVHLKREFLDGFCDADGHIYGDGRKQVGGINKVLLEQLRELAIQSGLSVSNLKKSQYKGVSEYTGFKKAKPVYTFTYVDRKYHEIQDERGIPTEKIRSITSLGITDVYDIEVENELHNFVVDGVIAHNCLMEDAALIHRIMRAPEKRMFYINVGNIPPNEIEQFMQKTINQMKKQPHIDPQTGEYNLRFNMQNMLEDFYIPVRGNDTATKIDTTKGLEYDGMKDVEYLRDKLFAALRVPKAYLGYEGDIQGKGTLSGIDIRFSRTVERIQRVFESELAKIALIHLYSQGIRGENLTNFELKLTTPSIIYEQEKVALLKEKVDLASQMLETKLFPTDYVYDHIFDLSEDSYMELRDLIREDSKFLFRLAQIENEGNDPTKSGRSYGTPHDLASMYGRRAEKGERVPVNYQNYEELMNVSRPDQKDKGGRPVIHKSIINTQEDPVGGRDRLGTDIDMKGGYPSDNDNVNESRESKRDIKTSIDLSGSKRAFHLLKEIDFIKEEKEPDESENSLLNTKNIKDLKEE